MLALGLGLCLYCVVVGELEESSSLGPKAHSFFLPSSKSHPSWVCVDKESLNYYFMMYLMLKMLTFGLGCYKLCVIKTIEALGAISESGGVIFKNFKKLQTLSLSTRLKHKYFGT